MLGSKYISNKQSFTLQFPRVSPQLASCRRSVSLGATGKTASEKLGEKRGKKKTLSLAALLTERLEEGATQQVLPK